MDTKLKSIYSKKTKFAVFFISVFLLSLAMTLFTGMSGSSVNGEASMASSYLDSTELASQLEITQRQLYELLLKYKSEANVRTGATISKSEFDSAKQKLYDDIYDVMNDYDRYARTSESYANNYAYLFVSPEVLASLANGTSNRTTPSDRGYYEENVYVNEATYDSGQEQRTFSKEYAQEIGKLYQYLIEEEVKRFHDLKAALDQSAGLSYYITDGKNTFTNTTKTERSYFENHTVYFIADKNGFALPKEIENNPRWARYNGYYNFTNYDNNTVATEQIKIYLAYDNDYIKVQSAKWEEEHQKVMNVLISSAILCFLAFLGFIFLTITIGRNARGGALVIHRLDQLYIELNLICIFLLILFWTWIFNLFYPRIINYDWIPLIATPTGNQWGYLLLNLANNLIVTTGVGIFVLSLIRRLKDHTFLKHTLIVTFGHRVTVWIKRIIKKVFLWIRRKIKTLLAFITSTFDGSRVNHYEFQKAMYKHQKIFFIVESILLVLMLMTVFIPPLSVFLGIIAVVGVFIFIRSNHNTISDMGKIVQQIEDIKDGDLTAQSNIQETSMLYDASRNLTSIGDGLKQSVESSLKSERMKVELVTNMSHDLKTPLTSIIAYADLLLKEEELPEHIRDYITILNQKANRLKVMIQDLFDLSKATSGNIDVELERLDYGKLIVQILGDLSESIEEAGLNFRVHLPEQPVYIMSDGKKMYRIFQNLITNALKYSLRGTRVYVELEVTKDGNALASIKNTANYDMDFDSKEIMERFVRGDKSRNTEGSGLGLSIAQSYTAACGGILNITKNADLFIAEVMFAQAPEKITTI